MSVQMVFATMGNYDLEAAAIDCKVIFLVSSFFSFRKCKCVPRPPTVPTRPLISPRPRANQCQAGAPCQVLGTKNECSDGVCNNG